MTRVALAGALLALLLATTTPPEGAHAALPPGYGGELRIPGDRALRIPSPADIRSPVEAMLADATFDTLYVPGASGPRPSLAAGPPEREGDEWRVRLRSGIRRHDRRPLRAQDVLAAWRRLRRTPQRVWLAGFATRGGGIDVRAVDENTLALRTADGASPASLLSARALAIAPRRGIGTGPFRPRMHEAELRMRQFRRAATGAPHLRAVRVLPPQGREEELRALELGELDVSWRGGSLYGSQAASSLRSRQPARMPVLLVPSPAVEASFGSIVAALDRARLARVGLRAIPELHPALPAPTPSGEEDPDSPLRLLVEADAPFQQALASAFGARFDEVGWRIEIVRVPPEGLGAALRRPWDLRILTLAPGHPSPVAMLASACAALGDDERAAELIAGGLEERPELAAEARHLNAWVVGHREIILHHPPSLGGVAAGPHGQLRLGALFLPRAQTTPGDSAP